MKKLLLTLSLTCFLGLSASFAQTVNDVPIKDVDVEYIQIVGTSKILSNKVTIEIDFGQENKFWSAKDTQVKDENGKLVVFNSMIDALNFMSKNGYEFVDAYAITVGNQNVYHYMMKKNRGLVSRQ
ncbi:hypothetical protein [Pontibacter brevis]